MISGYIWEPPSNQFYDRKWIRPDSEYLYVFVSTHAFMRHGAGEHVHSTDSKVVQAFFNKDITLAPREAPYTFAETKYQLGINDDKETIGIDQTQRAISSDDYAHRILITPKTTFMIDWSKVTFSITADGSKSIHGLKIVPEDIIFDPLTNENTKALFEKVDPRKIGRPISTKFNTDLLPTDDLTQISYDAVTYYMEELDKADQRTSARTRSKVLQFTLALQIQWKQLW